MKEMHPDLNLDDEVAALVEYIGIRWSPIDSLQALVSDIREVAMQDGRAWVDTHAVSSYAHERIQARETLLGSTVQCALSYDAVCLFLVEICFNLERLKDAGRAVDGPWDYSRRASSITYAMSEKYPGLTQARPLGWDELAQNYEDFAGQDLYRPAVDYALFKGVNSASHAAPGFTERTALPYVMYDERCQGRKAPRVMVAAVYSHFLFIAEQLNTYRLLDELGRISNLAEPKQVFNVVWRPEADLNPFIKALKALASPPATEGKYQEILEAQAEFNQLSEEEQRAIREANKARMTLSMRTMFAKENEEARQAKEAERTAKFEAIAKTAFKL